MTCGVNRLSRRGLLYACGSAVAAVAMRPLTPLAQPHRPFIAYLRGGTREALEAYIQAFLDELRRLGYTDGQNITIEWIFDGGQPAKQPALAADLVQRKPDVVFTSNGPAYQAIIQATATIPIATDELMPNAPANVAGPLIVGAPSTLDRFKVGVELVPAATRIGFFVSANAANAGARTEAESAATALGRKAVIGGYNGPEDVELTFRNLVQERVDFVHIQSSPITRGVQPQLISIATQARLPTVFPDTNWVRAGGLVAYGTDNSKAFRAMARVVDQLLKGAKPSEVPRERIDSTTLVLNLSTARQLGITIPSAMLARANEKIG